MSGRFLLTLPRLSFGAFELSIAVLALGVGWQLGNRTESGSHGHEAAAAPGKPLFYQSPMHPWIKK